MAKHSPDSSVLWTMLFNDYSKRSYICTQFSTHILVPPYSGRLDPSSWICLSCFTSSQQRLVLGVVASQSVAACGFPCVFFFFHLLPSLYLYFFFLPWFPPDLWPALCFLLCLFCFFIVLRCFFFFFAFSCSPIFSLSFCPSSVPIEVLYCMPADFCLHSPPIMMVACCSKPLSMSAAEHGRPGLFHYITMCACCCSAYITGSLRTISQLAVSELGSICIKNMDAQQDSNLSTPCIW